MVWLEVLFWISVTGVFYIYAGYPLLIGLLARLFPKPVQKKPNTLNATVIMSIYNEGPRLVKKIENLLAVQGSDRLVQILIGSDGSTDHPEAFIEPFNDPRIHLISFAERRGKPSVLNDLIPRATGAIIIMMDVRQRLDEHALPALLDNFSDPTIGVVSGELMFERQTSDTSTAESIDAYWRYEKWIRDKESRFGSVPGATGALYAIRRELACHVEPEAALDDVIIPMKAIASGYRCIFEPSARIVDQLNQDVDRESIRKRRTLAGCGQLVRLHPCWLIPFGHPIWWIYASHKIARLASPVLLALIAIMNLPLIQQPMYAGMWVAQVLFYITGLVGIKKTNNRHRGLKKIPQAIGLFLSMQFTLIMALYDASTRHDLAKWNKA